MISTALIPLKNDQPKGRENPFTIFFTSPDSHMVLGGFLIYIEIKIAGLIKKGGVKKRRVKKLEDWNFRIVKSNLIDSLY